jgi:hypothetical protein
MTKINELRKQAKELNINSFGMTKSQLEDAIAHAKVVEEVNEILNDSATPPLPKVKKFMPFTKQWWERRHELKASKPASTPKTESLTKKEKVKAGASILTILAGAVAVGFGIMIVLQTLFPPQPWWHIW